MLWLNRMETKHEKIGQKGHCGFSPESFQEGLEPGEETIEGSNGTEPLNPKDRIGKLIEMRKEAFEEGLWLPHMPKEWGGMELGHVAMAMVQAEAAKSYYGPWVLNCQAPDEGNMHTMLHWATDDQKEKYLRPLCQGTATSCFAMTEPEVAGSDPTLIQTNAYQDGEEWVINGHKWFISNAHRAYFAILIARTEDDPELPQAANTAFIIDLPSDGWTEEREIEINIPIYNDLGEAIGKYKILPEAYITADKWQSLIHI